MQFEYKITVDDYIASQLLYWKLSAAHKPVKAGTWCMLLATLYFVVAWNKYELDFGPILLIVTGVWWIYFAVSNFFPKRYLRHCYSGLELFGKKFLADVNEEGFEVTGDLCSWRVRWPGVLLKGEGKQVFIIQSEDGHIFMFGKKYLSEEQQQELRRFI